MTDFGWWAAQAPTGSFLCALCFELKTDDQATVDADGVKWDACKLCHRYEIISMLEVREVLEVDFSSSFGRADAEA